MTIDPFRDVLRRQPFQPFKIHVSGGRAPEIRHPDFVAQSPTRHSVIACPVDDRFEVIDLQPVTKLEAGSPRRKRGNGRRR